MGGRLFHWCIFSLFSLSSSLGICMSQRCQWPIVGNIVHCTHALVSYFFLIRWHQSSAALSFTLLTLCWSVSNLPSVMAHTASVLGYITLDVSKNITSSKITYLVSIVGIIRACHINCSPTRILFFLTGGLVLCTSYQLLCAGRYGGHTFSESTLWYLWCYAWCEHMWAVSVITRFTPSWYNTSNQWISWAPHSVCTTRYVHNCKR